MRGRPPSAGLTAVCGLVGALLLLGAVRALHVFDLARLLTQIFAAGLMLWSLGHSLRQSLGLEDASRKNAWRGLACSLTGTTVGAGVSLALTLYKPMSAPGEPPLRWPVLLDLVAVVVMVFAGFMALAMAAAIGRHPGPLLPARVRALRLLAVVVALAVLTPFPVNYLASRHNLSFDLAYFKAPAPGPATIAVAEGLVGIVQVTVFYPASDEVALELRPYFDALASTGLAIDWVDAAAAPTLARELGVSDNGHVVFRRAGESAAEAELRRFKMGVEVEQARRRVGQLDALVYRSLLEIAGTRRRVFRSEGHVELGTLGEGGGGRLSARVFDKLLGLMHVDSQPLTLAPGPRLSADAGVIMVLGPRRGPSAQLVDAAIDFFDAGGALWIAVEPEPAPDEAGLGAIDEVPFPSPELIRLLTHLGVRVVAGELVSDANYAVLERGLRDRGNIVSDRYGTHPSSSGLAAIKPPLTIYLSRAAGLVALDEPSLKARGLKSRVLMRSLQDNWLDANGNFELDGDEARKTWPLAVAVEATGGGKAIVTADSTMFADRFVVNPANRRFLHDGLRWLFGQPELVGGTLDEKDVRIEHRKQDQLLWFYGAVLLAPALLLGFGFAHVRRRQRRAGLR